MDMRRYVTTKNMLIQLEMEYEKLKDDPGREFERYEMLVMINELYRKLLELKDE